MNHCRNTPPVKIKDEKDFSQTNLLIILLPKSLPFRQRFLWLFMFGVLCRILDVSTIWSEGRIANQLVFLNELWEVLQMEKNANHPTLLPTHIISKKTSFSSWEWFWLLHVPYFALKRTFEGHPIWKGKFSRTKAYQEREYFVPFNIFVVECRNADNLISGQFALY